MAAIMAVTAAGWTTSSSFNLFESKGRFPYRGSGFCVVAWQVAASMHYLY